MALSTEKTDLDSLVNKLGEVQVTPTLYTVLGRLKTISEGAINPYSNPEPYVISSLFQRTVPTTNYANGQLINDINSISQILSFNKIGTYISIKHVTITSNSTIGGNPFIVIFNNFNGVITGQPMSDYQSFNPTYPNMQNSDFLYFTSASMTGFLTASPNIYTSTTFSTGGGPLDYKIKTELNGNIYYALICNTAFTPIASQRFKITISGDILSH